MSKRFDHSKGPSQRMLRAGENIRHVIVDILARGDLRDPAIANVSVTVGEVRMSPDLKHANVFVAVLGQEDSTELAAALNRASRYLRGEIGRRLESKFTPDLKFIPDVSYVTALKMNDMFNDPKVAQDLRVAKNDD
jgi:ribosome-binding factor A